MTGADSEFEPENNAGKWKSAFFISEGQVKWNQQ